MFYHIIWHNRMCTDKEREREEEMGLYISITIWSSSAGAKIDLDGWLSGTAPELADCQACRLVAWPASQLAGPSVWLDSRGGRAGQLGGGPSWRKSRKENKKTNPEKPCFEL